MIPSLMFLCKVLSNHSVDSNSYLSMNEIDFCKMYCYTFFCLMSFESPFLIFILHPTLPQ